MQCGSTVVDGQVLWTDGIHVVMNMEWGVCLSVLIDTFV